MVIFHGYVSHNQMVIPRFHLGNVQNNISPVWGPNLPIDCEPRSEGLARALAVKAFCFDVLLPKRAEQGDGLRSHLLVSN